MDVFSLRDELVGDYQRYVESFLDIADPRLKQVVADEMAGGLLWPEPKIGLNPTFAAGASVEELADRKVLHDACREIFRVKPGSQPSRELKLYRHQVDAIELAATGANYVLTTGTGSGKSLAYIVPIVDAVLRERDHERDHEQSSAERVEKRIRAIVVYPMNALANSQAGELEKFLDRGLSASSPRITYKRYTGQESTDEKAAIIADPPDILLTNYVMLELILTRPQEQDLVRAAEGLRFLVFDELHTYRGRQGADVALLARRVRLAAKTKRLQMIGTSATMSTGGTVTDQKRAVSAVATTLFGAPVAPEHVITETLRRATPNFDGDDPAQVVALAARLRSQTPPPGDYEAFVDDPLSQWIESTFGVVEEPAATPDTPFRLVRAAPASVGGDDGAARDLAALTGVDEDTCSHAIEAQLLAGYRITRPDTPFPVFAFRLHQFVSRGDTVFASIEPYEQRVFKFTKQRFVPGERERRRILLPLSFCRECGADYYSAWRVERPGHATILSGRELTERTPPQGTMTPVHLSLAPFPGESDGDDYLDRLPEDWIEETATGRRVKRATRGNGARSP